MKIDPEQLRRHYASLPDDALLELCREDLTDAALEYYDAEIFSRGLTREEEPADPSAPGDLEPEESRDWGEARRLFMNSVPWAKQAVAVHTFHFAPEAEQAREALDAAGIPNALAGDESRAQSFNLMVPEASVEAAQRVLDSEIFHPVFEDTLEKHFAVFSDDELLEMDREVMPVSARALYDGELDARGLQSALRETNAEDPSGDVTDLVAAATLLGEEAEAGRRILEDAGIPCTLEDDDTPTPLEEYRSVRLMVPAAQFDDASRILEVNAQKIIDAVRGDSL